MAKKDKNVLINFFKLAFTGALGGFLGVTVIYFFIGLFSVFFCVLGYYLVIKNNKKNTKPFEDLQKEQYLGAVLFFIGLLPWIRYFFISFMLNAGTDFYDVNF
jgi:uncharacterized membrane protein YfcA